jgi:hypothetical protein
VIMLIILVGLDLAKNNIVAVKVSKVGMIILAKFV